ncbi:MAG TPA: hypothetical protein VNZ22_09480, partial [Bacillota bacterium]|nr:hypothetical protein [Bacillota bacterium]
MRCHQKRTEAGWAVVVLLFSGLAVMVFSSLFTARAQQTNAAESAFQDDPAAHQLYREMIGAMRHARTLSWTGENRWKFQGRFVTTGTYRIWLKKPNYARVEVTRTGQ